MVDRSYTTLKGKNGLYRRIEFGETSVNNADTITLGGFHATTAITRALAISKVDGAAVVAAGVGATNAVAFTTGGEIPVYYMVFGVKA
jgi:hypothetical protein